MGLWNDLMGDNKNHGPSSQTHSQGMGHLKAPRQGPANHSPNWLQQTRSRGHQTAATMGLMIGFGVMMFLDTALG